jgi:hypothetical protein
MKLTIMDRFALLKVLPHEGSFATLKIVQELRLALSPSEQEHKEFEIKEQGNNIMWNPEKGAVPKEIPIGEKATDIIVMSLKKSDQNGNLPEEAISVYEKFIKDAQ